MGSRKRTYNIAAPDPVKTAEAQTKSNILTAISNFYLNAIDQESPYGSYKYVLDEENPYHEVNGQQIPNYKIVQEFSPEVQGLYDKRIANQGAIGDLAGESVSALGDSLYGEDAIGTGVGDALLERLEPGLQSDEENLINSLENRGIHRGSSLWKRALRENSVNKQEARATATIRGASEDRAHRGQMINEMLALLGASKGDSAQYISPYNSNIANTDVAGIANASHQANLQRYQIEKQSQDSLIGGLLGFGGKILGGLF